MVVVYRLDRFSREPLHYYQMIYEIEASGAELHDASEGRYQPGPEMAMLRGLKILLAKNETATLAARIRDAHRRMRSTGTYPGGPAPYGFRRVHPPGLEPDPEEAPWVAQIHEWFQRGWSIRRITRELNARGVPSRRGGQWLVSVVVRILQRPMCAGGTLDDDGRLITGGNITPIITVESWRRTQALMGRSRDRWQSGKTSRGPIPSRLCRCGTCGRSLRVYHRPPNIILECWSANDGACPRGVAIYTHVLERVVVERLTAKLKGMKAAPPKAPAHELQVAALDEEIEGTKAALERLALAYADGAMELPEYQGARGKLLDRLERARGRREKQITQVEREAVSGAIRVLWGDLGQIAKHPELLTEMPVEQRRELYELLVEKIVVRPMGQKPRVEVRFRL